MSPNRSDEAPATPHNSPLHTALCSEPCKTRCRALQLLEDGFCLQRQSGPSAAVAGVPDALACCRSCFKVLDSGFRAYQDLGRFRVLLDVSGLGAVQGGFRFSPKAKPVGKKCAKKTKKPALGEEDGGAVGAADEDDGNLVPPRRATRRRRHRSTRIATPTGRPERHPLHPPGTAAHARHHCTSTRNACGTSRC